MASKPKTLDDVRFGDEEKPSQSTNTASGGRSLDEVFNRNPQASSGINDITPSMEHLKDVARVGVPMALTAAAGPLAPGASLAGRYALEAGLSTLGEGALQATGVNEISPEGLGVAAAAPSIGRLAFTSLAQLPRLVPGFGQAARASMAGIAREMPNSLLKGLPSSKELYTKVAEGNVKAVLPKFPKLAEAVGELGEEIDNIPWDQLRKDLRGTGLENLFEDISTSLNGVPAKVVKQKPIVSGKAESIPTGLPKQNITQPGKTPGLSFQEADAAVRGFGRVIARTSDDVVRGNYKKLYNGLLADLENMDVPEGVPLDVWRQARNVYKQERTAGMIADKIEKTMVTKEGVDLPNPDAMVKWLRNDKEIRERFKGQPEVLAGFIENFRNMSKMEGKNASKFVATLVGASMTGNVGGALAGYIAAENLSKALMTPTGQRVVHEMIRNPDASKWRRLGAVLGASVGGAFQDYNQ